MDNCVSNTKFKSDIKCSITRAYVDASKPITGKELTVDICKTASTLLKESNLSGNTLGLESLVDDYFASIFKCLAITSPPSTWSYEYSPEILGVITR